MIGFRLLSFLEDPALNGLRFEMGASLITSFAPKQIIHLMDEEALRRIGQEGIDVEDFGEVKRESDGTLSYKGKRVVVYIRDVAKYKDSQSLPRFHFSFCRTLDGMVQDKRWHRYVVANREDGAFIVKFVGDRARTQDLRLNVCQNCLEQLGWAGFQYTMPQPTKRNIVQNFKLSDFFEKYPKDLLSVIPKHTYETAPINDYSPDWGMISERIKSQRGYVCEKCDIHLLGAEKKHLHVHHEDGDKTNVSPENLIVLCIKCHADEPRHSHMKALPAYKGYMTRFV